jgi:hypothetical protein
MILPLLKTTELLLRVGAFDIPSLRPSNFQHPNSPSYNQGNDNGVRSGSSSSGSSDSNCNNEKDNRHGNKDTTCNFTVELLKVLSVEQQQSTDVNKLKACVDIYLLILQQFEDPARSTALKYLVVLLGQKFPRVRKYTAEALYVQFLSDPYAIGPSPRQVAELLLLLQERRENTTAVEVTGDKGSGDGSRDDTRGEGETASDKVDTQEESALTKKAIQETESPQNSISMISANIPSTTDNNVSHSGKDAPLSDKPPQDTPLVLRCGFAATAQELEKTQEMLATMSWDGPLARARERRMELFERIGIDVKSSSQSSGGGVSSSSSAGANAFLPAAAGGGGRRGSQQAGSRKAKVDELDSYESLVREAGLCSVVLYS